MKRAYLGVFVVAVVALTLAPAAARLDFTDVGPLTDTGTPALPETFEFQFGAASIVCTFQCEDGIGFVLDPCNDGSLGACCANGEPACAAHGGLEDGICQKGRLGLPCIPF